MNQKLIVTQYNPVTHQGLGDKEYTVTGLTFNKENFIVTIQLADTTFCVSLEELAAEGRHGSVSNQILSQLREDDMTTEEKADRIDIRRRIDNIIRYRATESWIASRGERGL